MKFPIVLLDVGQTLIGPTRPFGTVYAGVYRDLGLDLPGATFERSIRETWCEMERTIPAGEDRYAHFPGGESEYWMRFSVRALERATGEPPSAELARDAVRRLREHFMDPAAWTVFPDVRPALEQLRDAGVRLGVVSNWDSGLPRLLGALELDGFFEVVGVSHLEGVEKPSPALFHRVLHRMNASPGSALHVGDVPELDRAGAEAAGIAAVLIDRRGELDREHSPIGDLSVLPEIARTGRR